MADPTELAHLEARIATLEAERAASHRRTRRGLIAVVVVAAFGSVGVFAADGNCPNGLPFCFTSGSPALAGQLNHNFAQLKEWLERKTGPVADPLVVASAGVRITNGDLRVDLGSLVTPRLSASPFGGTTFRRNDGTTAASVDENGNATFRTVRISGGNGTINLPHNCESIRQAGGPAGVNTVSCPANKFVLSGGTDCPANAWLNYSQAENESNGRFTQWHSECRGGSSGAFAVTPTSVSAICCEF